ncbi:alpha/beta fold hydrolase [Singulisphaera sp. PoT]|uniref:alpha/beta fold hydrolase n=1 Tax=Singulisphaera sp. PoT TaxID=3411797 RepID=UPI003BF5BA80
MASTRPASLRIPTSLLAALAVLGSVLAASGSIAGGDEPPDPGPKPTSQGKAQANGIEIAYETYGPQDGEPMLLIMGFASQLTAWPVELCDDLAKRGYRVIIFDNRDIGLSTKLKAGGKPDVNALMLARLTGRPVKLPYTLEDMAKDSLGLLDALGIKKAHVVGVSMGGIIAQILATDYPDRTLSLTSIMSTSGTPNIKLPAKPEVFSKIPKPPRDEDTNPEVALEYAMTLSKVLGGSGYPPDETRLREVIRRSMKRGIDDRASLARQNAAVAIGFFEDRRAKLKTIKVPTVVVHGAEDPLISVDGGKDTAANIPGAELIIIPGMGHDLPVALSRTLAEAIASAANRAKAK